MREDSKSSTVPRMSSADANSSTAYSGDSTQSMVVSQLLWRLCAPFILFVGIVGNCLTLLVLTGLRSGNIAFLFFLALAITDLVVLGVGLLPHWIGWQFGIWPQKETMFLCYFLTWTKYMSGQLSASLLAALTVHRAASAAKPFHTRRYCTQKVFVIALGALLLLVISCNVYVLIFTEYNGKKKTCKWEKKFHDTIYLSLTWVQAFYFSLIPSAVIIVSNVLLVRAVKRSKTRTRSVVFAMLKTKTSPNTSFSSATRPGQQQINVVILTVSIVFVCLTVPHAVLHVVDEALYEERCCQFGKQVTTLLWHTNSAVSFYLYILTSRTLRKRTADMLTRPCSFMRACGRNAVYSNSQLT